MVSFDVISLFTAIPVKKACDYIRKRLERDPTLSERTNLNIDQIISLLDFILSNNYFYYNDCVYKQVKGCAMGSPVSPVIANLCMEEIEEEAISNAITPPKSWYRYVDDCHSIIKKNAVESFHRTLNSIDTDISFSVEHETNGQLPFLDTLTIRRNNAIHVTVYRKPTHTDRYLDYNSHHDIRHKISTVKTLVHRARSLPTIAEDRNKELEHVSQALQKNGYPKKMISSIQNRSPYTRIPTPEELVKDFFDLVEPIDAPTGFAVLPYISGLTEPLTRILKKHNIKVANKPLRTLQQHFPSPKYRVTPEKETNVIYQIPCADCSWNYIGETGRSFETRKKEHIKNTERFEKNSNVAKHAWELSHKIDFERGTIIDKGNYRIRKTLESWHTAATDGADNNSKHLPEQYSILLKKH